MSDEDDRSYPPRAMTPYDGFGSRPKLAVADPLEGIPRLRSVPNLGDFTAQLERANRDTDPADPLGGDDDDDKTPAERPFEIRVEKELRDLRRDVDAIKRSSREMAQHTVDMYEIVKAIDKRQRAYEAERKWVTAVAWAINFVLVLWALLRTFR